MSTNQKRKTMNYIYRVANFTNNNFKLDRGRLYKRYDVNKFDLDISTKDNVSVWRKKFIQNMCKSELFSHISTDSTSIEVVMSNGVVVTIHDCNEKSFRISIF